MSGILKNLYYGNLAPADRAYAPTNAAKALRQDVQKQNEIAEKLAQCADERVRALFETYCELQAKISSAEQEELFIYAFRLGAQWCGEVFLPRTDPYTQEDF